MKKCFLLIAVCLVSLIGVAQYPIYKNLPSEPTLIRTPFTEYRMPYFKDTCAASKFNEFLGAVIIVDSTDFYIRLLDKWVIIFGTKMKKPGDNLPIKTNGVQRIILPLGGIRRKDTNQSTIEIGGTRCCDTVKRVIFFNKSSVVDNR